MEEEVTEEGLPDGAGRKKSDGQLEEWDYGFGEEGVIVEADGGQLTRFGTEFPWWGLVVSRLGLRRVNR